MLILDCFFSYSKVTVATQIQTVSGSDGHCSHPDPDQMVDQHIEMTPTALNISGDQDN